MTPAPTDPVEIVRQHHSLHRTLREILAELDWMNEQQAIKQNVNVLLHMIAGLVMAAIAVLPILLLQMALVVSVIYIVSVFGAILVVLVWRLRAGASKRMLEMDA